MKHLLAISFCLCIVALMLLVGTASAATPTILTITPATGANTTPSVSITNLAGTNFAAGATVMLTPVNAIPVHKGSIANGDGGAFLNGAQCVYVNGTYAYVVSWNGNSLEIVNITDPTHPSHKGSIVTGGGGGALLNGAQGIYVNGTTAYVASSDSNALEIVDVSNPAAPVHSGSIVNGGGASLAFPVSVYVSGNYAYVASENSNALEIVNVADPTHPAHVGSIATGGGGGGGALLNGAHSVFVSGTNAYVASSGSNALEIVDVSNPAAPTHKASIATGGGALLNTPETVFVSGNYAYVASSGSNALEIVDITDPAHPAHAGSIATGGGGGGGALLNGAFSVYVSGNYAYVASENSNALEVVDVSNPAAPTHKGNIVHGGSVLLNGPDSVFVSGTYAYVTSVTSSSLEIVDTGTVNATGLAVTATKITGTFDLTNKIAGLYNVVVTNPDGLFATLSSGFTVTGVPTVSGITPTSGATAGGTSVTITGAGFTGATAVKFGSTSATSYTVNSASQITATSPAGSAGTVDITVTNGEGTSATSASDQFTYTAPSTPTPTATAVPTNPPSDDGGPSAPANSGANSPVANTQGTSSTVSVNVGQIGQTSIIQVDATGVKVNDLIVTATNVNGPGTGIQPPPGIINEYVDITPERYTTITGAQITFVVPQSWLVDNHLTPTEIVLYHNVGTGWQALPTTFIKNENGENYYSAASPGFSRYAITGQVNLTTSSGNVTASPAAPTIGDQVKSSTTPPPTFAAPSPRQTRVPMPAQPVTTTTPRAGLDMIPILGALVLCGAIFLFRKNGN